MKRFLALVIGAITLTAFYLVHEQLPLVIRAPSSLLLSHVAIASGLLGLVGIDVYGNLALVFTLNAIASALVLAVWSAWHRRAKASSGSSDF